MSEIDTDEMRAVIEDKRDSYGDSPMLNRIEEMVDEIERLQKKLDQWQSCAVTAVERMTGRTWDDNPDGISPGQLASIAVGSVPRRELVEVKCDRDRYLGGLKDVIEIAEGPPGDRHIACAIAARKVMEGTDE